MRLRTGWWALFGAMALQTAVVGGSVVGCVGGSKGLSSEDKERLKPYILDAPPADIPHKVDINFENKVHLIGYKLEPELARPGQDVKITYYWRVDDPLDDGWLLFTHLHDDASDHSDNLDWSGPLREKRGEHQVLGPDRWQKGKVYVDEQTYKMPDWVKGPDLTVMTGIWKGDARLRVVSGPNDGDNRAIVAKIKTGLEPQPAHTQNDVPAIVVNKLAANEKITVDGKIDDKGWEGAASIGPFVDVGTGKQNPALPVQGMAKLAWDDTNLYVRFEVKSEDVVGAFTKASDADQKDMWTTTGQPKLWTKDTVEIMIDPDPSGDNKDYYEIQINPQNKVFHTQYDTYNAPKTEPNGPFGHEDWDPKLKSAVQVTGTLDKHDDKDTGYVVEAAIPWASFTKAEHHPPKNGDVWRMNLYVMKNNGGAAWSPILGQGNFHKASRFAKVTWAVPGAPGASDAGAPGSTAAAAHDGGANAGAMRMVHPAVQAPK